MRPYLLWISTGAAGPTSWVFEGNRQYDVYLHDYDTNYPQPSTRFSEYYINRAGEKLNVAGQVLKNLALRYRAVAFLDDDLSFTPDALNRAFVVGDALDLKIWQPSLTEGSYGSHRHLWQQRYNVEGGTMLDRGIRRVPFVEVMMPFFSQSVLEDALSTFDINESGWGLDCYMWPKIAQGYVLDGISFGHYRRPERRERILRNGLTPFQELWIQQRIHDPRPENFYPPGYQKAIEHELEPDSTS